MLDKIAKVVARYDEIERQMADPIVLADHVKLTELAQERSDLQPLVEAYHQHQTLSEELAGAREMVELEEDSDMIALAEDETNRLTQQLEQLEEQMRRLLIPKDSRDDKNVYVEIRAGAGGDEAGIFAADLARMYARYAEARNWKMEIVDESATGVGGYNKVTLAIKGKGAYSRFKFESGVHRVQRVPTTESQGRIHTSTWKSRWTNVIWKSLLPFLPAPAASTCRKMRRPPASFTNLLASVSKSSHNAA